MDKELTTGTWFFMDFGGGRKLFYVLDILNGDVLINCPTWSIGLYLTFTYSYLQERNISILGKGKRKWYWKFLPSRKNVVPFTKPKELWFL